MFEIFKIHFFKKQFVVFVIIGVINTFVGSFFSIIYSSKFQSNFAFILGYITGNIVSYLLNSKFTFKQKYSLKKYFLFFSDSIPNFLVQNLIVFVMYNVLNLNRMIAFISAAIIGVPMTYLILKFHAFRKK